MAFHCGYLVWWYVEQHASHMFIITFWHGNGNVLFDCMQFFFRWFLGKRLENPTATHHKSNKMTLKYFIFVWNHSHIHKYLITTFNKEYITLQGIQTSTFFFFLEKHFTACRHPPLSKGATAQRAWTGDAGYGGGVKGRGITALPSMLIGSSPQHECSPLLQLHWRGGGCVCAHRCDIKKNTNETKHLTCLRSVVEASVSVDHVNKNKNTSQT